MTNLQEMSPRELIRGLMRGDRAELKLGYSPANAVFAVKRLHPSLDEDEMRGYSQGFSDGMQGSEPMWVASDPNTPEHAAYRAGYADGLDEPVGLTYEERTQMGRRRSLTSQLYRAARVSNDISAVASGNPRRVVRRGVNVAKGRALARVGFWARLWR